MSDLDLNAWQAIGRRRGRKFRIKIWDKATGSTVYDNQMNAPYFVNDAKLVGAQPFEVFKTPIENALRGPWQSVTGA